MRIELAAFVPAMLKGAFARLLSMRVMRRGAAALSQLPVGGALQGTGWGGGDPVGRR